MTAPTCARCSRPIADGLPLCVTCGTELVKALYAIPAVVADLWVLRTGQDRFGDGGRSSDAPLPIRPARTGTQMVGELELDRLTNTVTTWARVIAEENSVVEVAWNLDTITAMRNPGRDRGRHLDDIPAVVLPVELSAWWLSTVPHLIRRHEAAGALTEEIIAAFAAARRVTDRPREMRPIGPCPTVLEDGTLCGVALLVDADEPPDWVRCPSCREQADVRAVEQATLAGAENLCWTADELLLMLDRVGEPVKRGTLDSWVSRRRLVAAMRNKEGRAMYRLGDARKLRAAGQQNEGGSAA